jgi:hypothetical protein
LALETCLDLMDQKEDRDELLLCVLLCERPAEA